MEDVLVIYSPKMSAQLDDSFMSFRIKYKKQTLSHALSLLIAFLPPPQYRSVSFFPSLSLELLGDSGDLLHSVLVGGEVTLKCLMLPHKSSDLHQRCRFIILLRQQFFLSYKRGKVGDVCGHFVMFANLKIKIGPDVSLPAVQDSCRLHFCLNFSARWSSLSRRRISVRSHSS